MRIYTKTERYIIWENKDFTYQIQMVGKEIDSIVYDYAADAIEKAEDLVDVMGLF